MKSVKQMAMVALAAVAALGFFGCASKSAAAPEKIELSSEASVTTIEHKGTGVGMNPPAWFQVYFDKQIAGLEAMSEYKGRYCVVGVDRKSVV
jgi:hypothetical protein